MTTESTDGGQKLLTTLLLDVIFVGEDDHSSGVARLHQTSDDLIELLGCRLTRNLH